MTSRRPWLSAGICVTLATGSILAGGLTDAGADPGASAGAGSRHDEHQHCSSGAHTLSHHGDQVYPETGNGGYRSLHTDVHLVYDAPSNRFLTGNHVDLTDRATQC